MVAVCSFVFQKRNLTLQAASKVLLLRQRERRSPILV
jgi:hypothetical protein